MQLQKLAVDFDVMRKLIDRKHVELKDKIEGIYDDNLRQAYRYIDGLTSMKDTIQTVQEEGTNIQIDTD